MKKDIIAFILVLFIFIFLFNSCTIKTKKYILIENAPISLLKETTISEFFGSDYRTIALNGNNDYSIGNVNKIVKRLNNFFILSDDNKIFQFDDEGNYISLLNQIGFGPEEYTRIEDFDVYESDGELIIWLADFNSIKIYQYNGEWKQTGKIKMSFIVNKFKILENHNILIMTGQRDLSLVLVNLNGDILDEYLQREIPYLTLKSVQFTLSDSLVIFPLGMSNDFVAYNLKAEKFINGSFVVNKKLINRENLLDMYKQFGYNFYEELKDQNYVKNLRRFGSKLVLEFSLKNQKYFIITSSIKQQTKLVSYDNEAQLINDVTQGNSAKLLSSIYLADSDDSLIFLEDPNVLNDNYKIIEFFSQ